MRKTKPDSHPEAKRDFPTSIRMSRRAKSILRRLSIARKISRSAVVEELILKAA